jgi:hypothetical protein
VNGPLEAICMKALQKKASERFQNAREMRVALRSILGAASAPARSPALLALADTVADRPPDSSKETLEGLTPVSSTQPPRRSHPWLATGLVVSIAGVAILVSLRRHTPSESASDMSSASQAIVVPRARNDPPTESIDSPAPPATFSALARSPEPMRAADPRPHRVKADLSPQPQSEPTPIKPPQAATNDAPALAMEAPAPLPRPQPATASATVSLTTPPPPPEPAPPAFDLASARVEIGQAVGTVGATSSSVTRAVSEAAAQLTGCYRAALPRLSGPIEGRGRVHIETDGAGIITDARLAGPLDVLVARCVASAIQGRRVANVDTGSASADVPLVFKAH